MKHDWEYKKLGEVCEIYQPKTISTNMLVEDGEYLVYGANGIIGRYDQYNHKDREILMTCRGATCGTINVSEPYSWINGNAMVIHPTSNDILFHYLKYHLEVLDLSNVITGAAQPQITRQSLSPIIISIPPLPIQEQIVAELDKVSEIIEKKKQQVKELDSLAQSIFYDMFGDPVENEKGWEKQMIGELCEDKKSIIRANKTFCQTDIIRYIDISSIDNKANVVVSMTQFVYKDAPSRAQQVVNYGDILVSLVRPNLKNIATVNDLGEDLVASSGFCVLRTKMCAQLFLKGVLLSDRFTKYLTDRVSGANYPAIREEDIKCCSISVPPLSLQQAFAEKVEAIEKQKELITASLKEAETLFDARMEYWFGE